jgi:hypothetical protein
VVPAIAHHAMIPPQINARSRISTPNFSSPPCLFSAEVYH